MTIRRMEDSWLKHRMALLVPLSSSIMKIVKVKLGVISDLFMVLD